MISSFRKTLIMCNKLKNRLVLFLKATSPESVAHFMAYSLDISLVASLLLKIIFY